MCKYRIPWSWNVCYQRSCNEGLQMPSKIHNSYHHGCAPRSDPYRRCNIFTAMRDGGTWERKRQRGRRKGGGLRGYNSAIEILEYNTFAALTRFYIPFLFRLLLSSTRPCNYTYIVLVRYRNPEVQTFWWAFYMPMISYRNTNLDLQNTWKSLLSLVKIIKETLA